MLVESSRVPDETWVVCENDDDARVALDALAELRADAIVHTLPTPVTNGLYTRVPYSHKINWVLDRSTADLFTYLDNGSMPHPDKYRVMADTIEREGHGAVYCTQQRSGHDSTLFQAQHPIPDGFCVLNHTQVMNRATVARWPEELEWGSVADGVFWRRLTRQFGPIQPSGDPDVVLDEHRVDGPLSMEAT